MSINSNKITAPVGLAEVYSLLGVTPTNGLRDIGYINSNAHGKTNKWSKKKPVRYAQPGELTDAQFKGTTADNAQGIYYGLKGGTQAGKLEELHNIDWEYLAPRPGTDWCRLTDWVGYDHNAKCTLSGNYTGDLPAYIEADRSLTAYITFDYQGKNTTGVDISDMLPSNTSADIGDYYPCILIGTYARVLYNTDLTSGSVEINPTYTPLHYNNVWYTRFFAHISDLPGVTEQTYQCTVFLIQKVYQAGIFDFRTSWANVKDTINAYNAFSVPGLINLSIPFAHSTPTYPTITITSVIGTWSSTSSGFSLSYTKGFTSGSYKFSFGITDPGPCTKEYTVFASGLGLVIQFKWTEVGIMYNPISDPPSRVAGSVAYIDDSGNKHVVSKFDLPVSY